nr:NAD-dependent epimerase/dehydratase family protein [Methanocella conradii]
MATALVTGCAGFIGSSLSDRLLKDGYKVTGIDCFTDYYPRKIKELNISSALKCENFRLVDRNILDMDSFPDVDFVFHQAAQAGVRNSWGKNFDVYLNDNVRATQKLLEFYKDKPIRKFVYASSSSVYGDSGLPMREDGVVRPVSPYGVTKLAGECLCYLYYKNYNMPTVSLRYFTVYGPRQRPDMAINRFTRSILKGDWIEVYGDGVQTRDFTFVDDVVEANLFAASFSGGGESFNIGGGSRISIINLIRLIEENVGKKANIRYGAKQKGDVNDTLADNSKARSLLGWAPKTDIRAGLKSYVNWYIANQYNL